MICSSPLPWTLLTGLMAASQAMAAPSVNVGMKAAFPAGPYLLELLETAAGENSTSYFPLLDRVAHGYFNSASSEADLYAKFLAVLKEDGHITSPDALSTFNLALSLRSAAPRIEAHYQYYSTAVEPAVDTTSTADCEDWVLFEGKQYCTPALEIIVKDGLFNSEINHLPFDRSLGAGREAILYADPTSAAFGAYHHGLYKAAQAGALKYRVRYRRNIGQTSTTLPVSGYGVELALKRTDYIVIDDREATQDSSQIVLGTDTLLDESEEVTDLKPLSTSELASIGMKASSFILQNDNPFDTLVKLTQDFPKFSRSIVANNVSRDFAAEYEQNQAHIRGGVNMLWMNGARLIDRQIEPFALVEMLRRERKLVNDIRDLGFTGKQAVSLLGHDKVSSAKSDDGPLRYDWTDRLEDGRVIVWLNDLENDERYGEYPKSLTSLLQRTYPGQMPPIARNIFNLIVPVDFSDAEDLTFFAQIASFLERGVPVRFGLVPLASTAEAASQAKIVYYLAENYGPDALVHYALQYQDRPSTAAEEQTFATAIEDRQLLPDAQKMTFGEVIDAASYEMQIKVARRWTKRLNADTSIRPIFVDGLAIPRDKSWMQTMSMKISEDLQTIQKGIFHGVIGEDTWVPGVFLEDAALSRNVYIAIDDENPLRVLDVTKIYKDHSDLFDDIPVLDSSSDSTKENWAVLTVVADLATEDGLGLVVSSLAFKRNNPGIRLELLHNPKNSASNSRLNGALKINLEKIRDLESVDKLRSTIEELSTDEEDEAYGTFLANFLAMAKITAGDHMVIHNGRVVGPITPEAPFQKEDFLQLLQCEHKTRVLPVYAAVDNLDLSKKLHGPLAAAKLTSIIALSTISDLPEGIFSSGPSIRSTVYDTWNSTHTALEVGDAENAGVHIVGIFNPVSEQGQRWAPILKVLSELDGIYIKLFLNPSEKIDELPVKRFFRYVMESKPSFDDKGKVQELKATFKGLPSEALLTAGMDVPPAWLVAPKASVHDLDNIKLSSVKSDIEATYELEHILIEGHSREGESAPPRGAQLVLATEANPLVTDTIIMSNLGFFQFKANPGYYNIQLKEGRSAGIFKIDSIGAQGWEPVAGDEGNTLALMDFRGTTLYPRLKRQPGMEEADVLEEEEGKEAEDGIIAKGFKFAEGLFGGNSKSKSVSAKEQAEINIFSVASGHLYERMLNIMMVSVMRHTEHTVKFWFIEQFLSPSFKDFIPHMAEAYGFKYEMVTYKWPHWLRQQKEKQREIWGYKILFLDVLFPLSLDKVIFVDADQIVRTDMMDLVNYDLEGAPYGFTPMCDSRTEMEGFRFWKQGYWNNYLRGRPYHISALYVVDLRRFRELAAGDRLRQQYQSLSADPNSLANLDQDLPNHMQFQIPIHSLPQEWLWCETWCSDESQAQARTIDLCNNPQTKEPKLDRARRQVPEWTTYDEEIAALDKQRRGEKKGVEEEEKGKSAVNTKSRRFEEENVHVADEL